MHDAILAETTTLRSDEGDDIEAYIARPLDGGPHPGVVVIHHMPGYDLGTKEIARNFATHGYMALMPNLFHRYAPTGTPSDEAAAAARAAGGAPDAQVMKDVGGAVRQLRAMPDTNGKVGVIGYCSGGRQTWLSAAHLPIDAAVVCYGGNIVAGPEQLSDAHPVAPIDLTPQIGAPILGLFGVEDRNPSPEHVERMRQELTANGKEFELHSYEDAGHSFFTVDRPAYRVEAAKAGWLAIWDFYGRHLAG